jgi:hypothetical protein
LRSQQQERGEGPFFGGGGGLLQEVKRDRGSGEPRAGAHHRRLLLLLVLLLQATGSRCCRQRACDPLCSSCPAGGKAAGSCGRRWRCTRCNHWDLVGDTVTYVFYVLTIPCVDMGSKADMRYCRSVPPCFDPPAVKCSGPAGTRPPQQSKASSVRSPKLIKKGCLVAELPTHTALRWLGAFVGTAGSKGSFMRPSGAGPHSAGRLPGAMAGRVLQGQSRQDDMPPGHQKNAVPAVPPPPSGLSAPPRSYPAGRTRPSVGCGMIIDIIVYCYFIHPCTQRAPPQSTRSVR